MSDSLLHLFISRRLQSSCQFVNEHQASLTSHQHLRSALESLLHSCSVNPHRRLSSTVHSGLVLFCAIDVIASLSFVFHPSESFPFICPPITRRCHSPFQSMPVPLCLYPLLYPGSPQPFSVALSVPSPVPVPVPCLLDCQTRFS